MTHPQRVPTMDPVGTPAGRPPAASARSWRSTATRLAPLALIAAITAAVAVRDPHGPESWGVCPTQAILGIDCPGCGSLRALHDLTAGRWVESMGHNALIIPAVLFIAYATVRRPGTRWSLAWTVVFLVFTVLRNLPGSPLAA